MKNDAFLGTLFIISLPYFIKKKCVYGDNMKYQKPIFFHKGNRIKKVENEIDKRPRSVI